MKWEDKILNQYVEKNRLSEWLRTTLEAAQVDVNNVADEATKAGAAAAAVEEPQASSSGGLFAGRLNGKPGFGEAMLSKYAPRK